MNVLTRNPHIGEIEGNADAEIGNYDAVTLNAGLTVPLGPTLALRASGTFLRKHGYTQEGLGDDRHEAGRIKLLWQPTADVSLLLSGSIGHTGGLGTAFDLRNPYPGNGPWVDAAGPQGRAFQVAYLAQVGLTGLLNPVPDARGSFQDQDFHNVSAELNWNLGEGIKLTVLPAFRDSRIRNLQIHAFPYFVGDGAGNVPPHPETARQVSVEARLSGESERLKWVAGAYFYDERQHTQYTFELGPLTNQLLISELQTRNYAAFGQVTWSLTPSLRLTGGLRYTSDRRTLQDGIKYNVFPAFGCLDPAVTLCPLESYQGAKTFRNASWKVGVEYDLTSQNLLFATASSGFKAGGFNEQIDFSASGTNGPALAYRPEKLYAYEFGMKNRFLDKRLQLNVEAFYWNYKDHQEGASLFSGAGNVNFSFVNAGNARMYGGSIETIAKPWHGATLRGNIEYNNSKYLSFNIQEPLAFIQPGVSTGCLVTTTSQTTPAGPLANIDCSGRQLSRAPTWTGSVSFSQSFPIGDGRALVADADLNFASSRWLSTDFIPVERAPDYQVVNAALTYTAAHNRFHIGVFGRNLTNAAVYTGGFIAPLKAPLFVSTVQAPRTYGIRLGVNF